MKFHLGNQVTGHLRSAGISKSELARRLGTTPQQVHVLLKRKSFGTDVLQRISKALRYDFFIHVSPYRGVDGKAANEMRERINTMSKEIETLRRHNGYLKELLELHKELEPSDV